MGEHGARCFHTLKPDSRAISKEEWDRVRIGMVCGSAQAFGDNKAAIEKLCNKSKACVYVDSFYDNLDEFTAELFEQRQNSATNVR